MSAEKTCPACGKIYDGRYSASSRLDNKTKICPECGERETLFFPRGAHSKKEMMAIIWHIMRLMPCSIEEAKALVKKIEAEVPKPKAWRSIDEE